MARKPSDEQKNVVGRVMHEFKQGKLESGGGGKVRNPKQAIAIALHEAGNSNQQSAAENKRALNRTMQRARAGQTGRDRAERSPSRADLYARAKRAGLPGRSKMNKAQLQDALNQNTH